MLPAVVALAACSSSTNTEVVAAGPAPTAQGVASANPGNPDATRPPATTTPRAALTYPAQPSSTPPSAASTTTPAAPAASGAPGEGATAADPSSTTIADLMLPPIVKPLDPPPGSGPVPTDAVPIVANPSRPVGVPLAPGEPGYTACQVSIVGDSLTVAGGNAIADALRADGCAAIAIAAKGGANTRYGVRLATDLRDAGLLTNVVLVNMGTNDCASSAAELDAAIEEMFKVLGSKRVVVWPTTNIAKKTPFCTPDGDLLANERIRAAATRHPNMHVVDWWSLADQHPEWHPDGVHHNRDGQRAWAFVLAEGVAQAAGVGP
jgi:lysophospholipase L1-like esterase